MFNVSLLPLNAFFKALAPLVCASDKKALNQISPLLDYCQLKLLHCGKFAPKVDVFLQCNPYGLIDWVQIRTVRWPLAVAR